MATKRGAFSGRRLDDHAVMVFDGDTDITEAAMAHPHTANPLFREGIVQGNNLVVQYVPNRAHGLSPLQVAISTTKHGPCHILTPMSQAIMYNSAGEAVISLEAYETWKASPSSGLFKAELVPTADEVRESLATIALDGDVEDAEVFAEVKASISQELLNRYPHLERGPRILNEAIRGMNPEDLEGLDEEELLEMLNLAKSQGQLAIAAFIEKFLGGPSTTQQELLMEVRTLADEYTRLDKELDLAVEWEREGDIEDLRIRMENLDEQLQVKVEMLEKLSEELKGIKPVERPNWGIPALIFNAYNILNRMTVKREVGGKIVSTPSQNTALARRRFVGFVEEAELTCIQAADMAVAEYGNDIPLFRKAGDKKLTYELVTQAIQDEERRFARELESWSNGSDAVSRSMNMGNLVQGLIAWEEEKDARPRPEMCDEPVSESALGDFEEEALKRDLERKTTPRDSEQWMGELAEWSAEVPYVQTQNGSAGHPLAWLIQATLSALSQDHEETQLVDDEGEQLLTEKKEVLRLLSVTIEGVSGNLWTTTIDGNEALILKEEGTIATVMVKKTAEEFGFVYTIKETDTWCIGSQKDEDGGTWQEGDTVGFRSRLGFIAWRASFVTLPTLELTKKGQPIIENGYNGPFIPVIWAPLAQVFPKLCEFILWAQDSYETGSGWMGDMGLDDDMGDRLWELQAELSQYQSRMMKALVDANIEVHFGEFTQELQAAWEMYREDSNIANMRFEDGEGRSTSLYGRLSSILWASMTGLTGETVVAPRPMTITGKQMSEDLEQEVSLWGLNETLMWRALGYALHENRYRHGINGLANMVKENIVRANPLDVSNRAEWWRNPITGKSYRRMVAKRVVTWTENGDWSVGVLGDALAEWWNQAIGIHLPAVKGNVLAMDNATIRERLGWTHEMAQRLVRLSKVWGRSKSLRLGGLQKLIEMLLPLPSPEAKEFKTVYKMRLQLQSPTPLLTGEMVEKALLVIDGEEQERRLFVAAIRSSVDDLGVDVVRALTQLID
jgi:hypothetical protein